MARTTASLVGTVLLLVAAAACDRSPSGEAQHRPAAPPGPAGWAVRHGEETGAPSLDRRQEAAQPATAPVYPRPDVGDRVNSSEPAPAKRQ
jgi:hypothetical protein